MTPHKVSGVNTSCCQFAAKTATAEVSLVFFLYIYIYIFRGRTPKRHGRRAALRHVLGLANEEQRSEPEPDVRGVATLKGGFPVLDQYLCVRLAVPSRLGP